MKGFFIAPATFQMFTSCMWLADTSQTVQVPSQLFYSVNFHLFATHTVGT